MRSYKVGVAILGLYSRWPLVTMVTTSWLGLWSNGICPSVNTSHIKTPGHTNTSRSRLQPRRTELWKTIYTWDVWYCQQIFALKCKFEIFCRFLLWTLLYVTFIPCTYFFLIKLFCYISSNSKSQLARDPIYLFFFYTFLFVW